MNPQSFSGTESFLDIVMSPFLAHFYKKLQQKNIPLLLLTKFALGMIFCAISFILLFFARFFATPEGLVTSSWLIFSYIFQSLGELLVQR